jgi:spermidine synthase
VQPRVLVDRAETLDGHELTLYRHDEDWYVLIDGDDLMSSRAHGSEEELAELGVGPVAQRPAPRVLVGGLGLGYTLRAALDQLAGRPRAEVVVAEVSPAVVAWNRGPVAHLAGEPLSDPRVRLATVDVSELLIAPDHPLGPPYDAILLDVDNGPDSPTLERNLRLYTGHGIERTRTALTPGGVLAVWAIQDDPPYVARLRRAGFQARVHRTKARHTKGSRHTLFIASRP